MTAIQEPKVRVLVEQPGQEDLVEYDVQTDNRDRIRWDIIRSRKNWPKPGDAASLWMTVLAWNALRRSGIDVGTDPEAWLDLIVGVYMIDEEGNLIRPDSVEAQLGAGAAVDPTQPGADIGS